MNAANLHLILNHFPVILPIVSVFLFLCYFLIKNETSKKTILIISYLILIVSAILTLPTFLSGENAEDIVEKLNNVEEVFIESHEELAETFAYLSYLLGAISIIGLWSELKSKSFAKYIYYVSLLFNIIVIAFSIQTAHTGGEIRHQEIRSNFNSEINTNSDAKKDND